MSLLGKIIRKVFTTKVAKTAEEVVTDTIKSKPVIPIVENAAKRVNGIKTEQLMGFLGKDIYI